MNMLDLFQGAFSTLEASAERSFSPFSYAEIETIKASKNTVLKIKFKYIT